MLFQIRTINLTHIVIKNTHLCFFLFCFFVCFLKNSVFSLPRFSNFTCSLQYYLLEKLNKLTSIQQLVMNQNHIGLAAGVPVPKGTKFDFQPSSYQNFGSSSCISTSDDNISLSSPHSQVRIHQRDNQSSCPPFY